MATLLHKPHLPFPPRGLTRGLIACASALLLASLSAHALTLTGVQSRKTHGQGAGTFDLPIRTDAPMSGHVSVESRTIGAGHAIVFQFDEAIVSPGTLSAIDDSITPLGDATLSFSGNEVMVALPTLADNHRVEMTLSDVNGSGLSFTVAMGFRVGDVDDSGAGDDADVRAVKARSGQIAAAAESIFRYDFDTSGVVSAADIAAAKARIGTPALPRGNAPPVVNAGADQVTVFPQAATLSGSAVDDGLPAPAALTYAWSYINGPGNAIFANAASAGTTVAFSSKGTYALRLTVSDGQRSGHGDTHVVVSGAASMVVISAGTGPFVSGQPVTLIAFVTSFTGAPAGPNGPPAGTVTFQDGGVDIAACTARLVVANTSGCTASFAAGVHSLRAVYSGDSQFAPSTSTLLSHTVNKAATTVSVATDASPAVIGQPVTFTATIAVTPPGAGGVSGTVSFKDGVSLIAGCEAVTVAADSTAVCTTGALPRGAHTVNASYSGNSNFTASSQSVSQTVNAANTTVTFTSSINPATFGLSLPTLTAVISPVAPGAGIPTGTVSITNTTRADHPPCLAQPMVNGVATCQIALAQGPNNMVATYSGDANFNTSTTTLVQYQKGPTQIGVQSSGNPSVFGQPVTFTAKVILTNGFGTPTGTVAFFSRGVVIGGCDAQPISAAGIATCSTSNFSSAGQSFVIRVDYSGDDFFLPSTVSNISQMVVAASTSVVVTVSSPQTGPGTQIRFQAQVAPVAPGAGTIQGLVAFKDGGTAISGCTASSIFSGIATCTASHLTPGAHSITATYNGSGNFNGSTSSALAVTIQ